jgi:oxygen-independent coproporphyrinogen-3 oxidase
MLPAMDDPVTRFAAALNRPVPRYTSYPTAPHFRSDFGASAYAAWLAAIPPESDISLYVHVPYCVQLCWYCGCHTRVASSYDSVLRYRDALLTEIAAVGRRLPGGPKVTQIHWGGGTPTVLRPDDFRRIDEALKSTFTVAADAEIAVEIDPRSLGDDMVSVLAAAGVNRVSFGVQDFNPRVQAAINRIQSYATTRGAVDRLRSAGVQSVNLDLLYGLPLQTEASVRETIDLTLDLQPDRLALFGYAHVPWMKSHQRLIKDDELPGPGQRWAQATAAAAALAAGGYMPVGIDHFARPHDALARAARDGTLHRNFQGYTTDAAPHLIGLGASAISRVPQGYAQNQSNVREWLERIEAGQLGTARGLGLDAEDRLRADIIERVMCDLTVDLDAVTAAHGTDSRAVADAFPALEALARDGIATLAGARVGVTAEARLLARLVAAAFDTYLAAGRARHSVAV